MYVLAEATLAGGRWQRGREHWRGRAGVQASNDWNDGNDMKLPFVPGLDWAKMKKSPDLLHWPWTLSPVHSRLAGWRGACY